MVLQCVVWGNDEAKRKSDENNGDDGDVSARYSSAVDVSCIACRSVQSMERF